MCYVELDRVIKGGVSLSSHLMPGEPGGTFSEALKYWSYLLVLVKSCRRLNTAPEVAGSDPPYPRPGRHTAAGAGAGAEAGTAVGGAAGAVAAAAVAAVAAAASCSRLNMAHGL